MAANIRTARGVWLDRRMPASIGYRQALTFDPVVGRVVACPSDWRLLMIRITLILTLLATLAISTGAYAQTTAEAIEQALAASPARAREGATVIKWNPDYTYETLKEGTNMVVCYSRADERERPPFAVQCTVKANLDRVAQNRKFRAESTSRDEERASVSAAGENGTRVAAEYGSFFRRMEGEDQASARIHQTIAMPEATGASAGFPENRDQGGAYIMAAGTSEAHLMIP